MSDKRMNAIDGLVLRIMKDRKVLGHDELVSECIKQLYSMFKVQFNCNFIFLFWISFVSLLNFTFHFL